ncbi:hypothetical protein M405DRAFT_848279, partial [Rhizopogon salebrosus TDB-379]
IFGAQWLRKRGEAASEYAPAFNPVPLQTLALIATAIECALRDYVKGFKEMQRGVNDFSSDLYRGSYGSHLSTLQTQERKHPQLILKLRRDIFQAAFNSIGDASLMEENHDYLGDFDLEADMAQCTDTDNVVGNAGVGVQADVINVPRTLFCRPICVVGPELAQFSERFDKERE